MKLKDWMFVFAMFMLFSLLQFQIIWNDYTLFWHDRRLSIAYEMIDDIINYLPKRMEQRHEESNLNYR